MIKQLKFMLAVGVLAASGAASATTCQSATQSYANVGCNASCKASILANHPECFGSSSNTAAAAQAVQATSLEQMLVISSNVGSRATVSAPPGVVADSGTRKGLAAGNPSGKWNAWASIAESDLKYDRGAFRLSADAAADVRENRFNTRIQNLVLGGDYQWAPNLALGLSAAFDSGSGSAVSNKVAGAGAAVDPAKAVSTSGYSYAPYLGWQINRDWALDATVGWGKSKSTVDSRVKTDGKRFFYGTNLSYTSWQGNWQLTGKGSYLFGQENNGDSRDDVNGTLANTNIKNEVGQFRLAGQTAIWMNGVMPYFGLAYATDQRSSSASADQKLATEMGKSAWVWGLGANFISIKNAMTGGIGYEQETGRSRSKNNKLMANINVRF